jgi:hypothetical protein
MENKQKKVKTEAELAEAIKNGDNTIEIEGDLANKTFKIKATGKVAWGIALAAVGIAVYAAITTIGSGGTTAPVTGTAGLIAAPAAVSILGGATTYSAIAIAVAAGGVGVLNKLRSYKQISYKPGHLVLQKK